MSDFRMNKNKPIGSKTLSTIAGYNTKRRPAPPPEPKPEMSIVPTDVAIDRLSEILLSNSGGGAFELTPDLSEAQVVEKVPVAEALGVMITPVEKQDESTTGDGTSAEYVRSDSDGIGEVVTEDVSTTMAEEIESVEAEPEVAQDSHNDVQIAATNGDTGVEDAELPDETETETVDSKVEAEQAVLVVTPPTDFTHEDADNVIEPSEESN